MWTAEAATRSADTSETTTDGGVAHDPGCAATCHAQLNEALT